MAEARNTDVLILGGGVIGLACAHYLLEAGRGVTVLEQGTAGCGSSHGNCGTLTPSHATPLAMPGVIGPALRAMLRPDAPLRIAPRLDLRAVALAVRFRAPLQLDRFPHRDAREGATADAFAPADRGTRALRIARLRVRIERHAVRVPQRGRVRALALAAARAGEIDLAIETLDAARVHAMEPALKPGVVAGYFNPGDAHLRPDRYVDALARLVRAKGGVIEEGARIECDRARRHAHLARAYEPRQISPDARSCSRSARGRRRWRSRPDFDCRSSPARATRSRITRPALCPRIPLVLKERAVCVTSWSSGYRLGSTMEFAGYDTSLNRTRLDALRRGAAEYLHEPVGPAVVEEWYGWRPMTPDDLPMLGRAPRHGQSRPGDRTWHARRQHVGDHRASRQRSHHRKGAVARYCAVQPGALC